MKKFKKIEDIEINKKFTEEQEVFIYKIAEEVLERLDYREKKVPDSPLPFKAVMSHHGAACKRAGLSSVNTLAMVLEELGYIYVIEFEPTGARYVYSGNSTLDQDTMLMKVYEIEGDKHRQKIEDAHSRKYPNG